MSLMVGGGRRRCRGLGFRERRVQCGECDVRVGGASWGMMEMQDFMVYGFLSDDVKC